MRRGHAVSAEDRLIDTPQREEIARICGELGLGEPHTIRSGTDCVNDVFIVDDRLVVKFWTDDPKWFDREVEILELLSDHGLHGRRFHGCGRAHTPPGQRYLVRGFIRGVPWSHVVESIPRADRLLIAEALGRDVAGFHLVPKAGMRHFDLSAANMRRLARRYAGGRLANWRRRHPDAVPALEAYVRAHLSVVEDVHPILGNNDIYEDHILVLNSAGTCAYAGFIDFGDADCSEMEYEIVKIHMNAFRCDPDLTNAFLRGYRERRDVRLSLDKCKLYGILHRFSDARTLIDWPAIGSSPDRLEQEMDRLWQSVEAG